MEINNLSQILIMEILCRLIFKDIMKCKCICKRWQALITNPTFFQYRRQLQLKAQSSSHYKKSQNPVRLFVCSIYITRSIMYLRIENKTHLNLYTSNNINNEDSRSLKLTPQKTGELEYHMEVMSSSFLKLVLLYVPTCKLLYLHNPSTDEFMALPKNYNQEHFYIRCVGLGQVKSTKEYKVVRVVECTRGVICEVFTLGSDYRWREVAPPPIYDINSVPSIFVAGGMYMFDHRYGILRFDIEGEEWMEILLPDKFWLFPSYWTIREVDGLLCMTDNSTQLVSMWLLKDYEKGLWALERSINIDYNFKGFLNDFHGDALIYPLSFDYGDGKMLLMFAEKCISLLNNAKLLSYDPITLHVEQLPNPYSSSVFTATFFTENFEPLL